MQVTGYQLAYILVVGVLSTLPIMSNTKDVSRTYLIQFLHRLQGWPTHGHLVVHITATLTNNGVSLNNWNRPTHGEVPHKNFTLLTILCLVCLMFVKLCVLFLENRLVWESKEILNQFLLEEWRIRRTFPQERCCLRFEPFNKHTWQEIYNLQNSAWRLYLFCSDGVH
jgi:hypothetical protein